MSHSKEIKTIQGLLFMFFNNNRKVHQWMRTRNPLLANLTPTEMIMMGRFEKLKAFIEDAIIARDAFLAKSGEVE